MTLHFVIGQVGHPAGQPALLLAAGFPCPVISPRPPAGVADGADDEALVRQEEPAAGRARPVVLLFGDPARHRGVLVQADRLGPAGRRNRPANGAVPRHHRPRGRASGAPGRGERPGVLKVGRIVTACRPAPCFDSVLPSALSLLSSSCSRNAAGRSRSPGPLAPPCAPRAGKPGAGGTASALEVQLSVPTRRREGGMRVAPGSLRVPRRVEGPASPGFRLVARKAAPSPKGVILIFAGFSLSTDRRFGGGAAGARVSANSCQRERVGSWWRSPPQPAPPAPGSLPRRTPRRQAARGGRPWPHTQTEE